MGYDDRHNQGFERWDRMQPSRSERLMQRRPRYGQQGYGQPGYGQGRFEREESFEPRERRPFGNEDFGQEREEWREPHDIQERERFDWERGPQYGQSQYGQPYGGYGEPQWGRSPEYGSSHLGSGMSGQRHSGYPGQQSESWGQQDWTGQRRDSRGRFAGRGPKNYRRSDERIQEDVNQALCDHPDLDASEIEVAVKNGEVTLRGTVPDRYSKRLAEEAIERLPGVADVRNEIRMSASGQQGMSSGQSHQTTFGQTHSGYERSEREKPEREKPERSH